MVRPVYGGILVEEAKEAKENGPTTGKHMKGTDVIFVFVFVFVFVFAFVFVFGLA